MTPSARLSWWLGLASAAAALVRSGSGQVGLLLLALAMACSLVVILGGIYALFTGRAGGGRGFLGFALAAAVFAFPAWSLFSASVLNDAPPIHDISTDLNNPPQFAAVLPYRTPSANPLDRAEPANLAILQKASYPDIAPLKLPIHAGRAFELARQLAQSQPRWTVITADPADGEIEGWAATLIMGYRDDFVIRVRDDGNGAVVDMRSASRIGVSDLGANARRIKEFFAALKSAAEN